MRILFTNMGPWGTGSATVVDAVSLEMMRGEGQEVLSHLVKLQDANKCR